MKNKADFAITAVMLVLGLIFAGASFKAWASPRCDLQLDERKTDDPTFEVRWVILDVGCDENGDARVTVIDWNTAEERRKRRIFVTSTRRPN